MTIDSSPTILAETLFEIGRIHAELVSNSDSRKWEAEDYKKKVENLQYEIRKLLDNNISLDRKYQDISDIAKFEATKAVVARTFIASLIDERKLKGKDLKTAKEALDIKKINTSQTSTPKS